ncbi:MAG TPA: hypothetical protein VFV81_04465 [Verrucomicrobiae bacterium]|nr:hypothetical protein [Verrucomicrobiae bacterium]
MKRAVRSLIQIIAGALMIFAALEIGLELEHHALQVRNHVEPIQTNIWRYVIGAVLLALGLILFAGSNSLAEQLTDDFDDNDE